MMDNDFSKYVSMTGYKKNSPDRNNPMNIIPSGKITMIEDDGTPLAHPVMAIKPDGGQVVMQPGKNYDFGKGPILEVPAMYNYDEMFGKLANTKPLPKAQYGGDQVYTFSGRQDSKYKNVNGKWHIQNNDTDNKFVEIEDPTGKRSAVLNKQAKPLNSNRISPEQQKGWDELGKKLVLPKQKIPTNMGEAQQMMDSGELDYESWDERKVRNQKEADARKNQRVKSLTDYEKRYNNPNYNQFTGLPGESYRDNLANEAAPLSAKFRTSQEDNIFDDYLNPAVWIGSMAQALGEAPKKAKETDSYMPYVTSIGAPLLAGAMGGLGASGNKQFVNNLVNPVAGMKVPFTNKAKQVFGEQLDQLSKTMVPKNTTLAKTSLETPPPFVQPGSTPTELFQKVPDKRYNSASFEQVERFKQDNPDRFKKVIEENWGSNLDESLKTKDAQEKAFKEATDFANDWYLTDKTQAKDISKKIKDLQGENYSYNLTPEEEDVISQINKLKSKTTEKFLEEKNMSSADYFSLITSKDPTEREKFRIMSEETMDRYEKSPQYKGLQEQHEKIKSKIDNAKSKINVLSEQQDMLLDPDVKRKIENLYEMAGQEVPTRRALSGVRMEDPKLVYYDANDPSFTSLPEYDQDYLNKNFEDIAGVKTRNHTITLGSKPVEKTFLFEDPIKAPTVIEKTIPKGVVKLTKPSTWKNLFEKDKKYDWLVPAQMDDAERTLLQIDRHKMYSPDEIAATNVHEIGHDQQDIHNWVNLVQENNPTYKYYTGHDRNDIAGAFKDAMVEPTLPVKDRSTYETWKSGVGELHSELISARYKAAKHYAKEHNISMTEAKDMVKTLEREGNDNLYDYYLTEGDLDKHFKENTGHLTKRMLLKTLPVAIPAIGTAAAIGAGSDSPSATNVQQQKYGGDIEQLDMYQIKGEVKTFKRDIRDQDAQSNTGWSSAPTEKKKVQPTAKQIQAQKSFDKNFKVTDKSKYEKTEDKIVTEQQKLKDWAKEKGIPITDKDLENVADQQWSFAGVGPQKQPDMMQATPEQSNSSRAWEYATNPFTAVEYAISGGGAENMPHNINEMKAAGYDPGVVQGRNLVGNMLNTLNPLDDVNMIQDGVKDVFKGDNSGYATAGFGLLGFIPGGDYFKGLRKIGKTAETVKDVSKIDDELLNAYNLAVDLKNRGKISNIPESPQDFDKWLQAQYNKRPIYRTVDVNPQVMADPNIREGIRKQGLDPDNPHHVAEYMGTTVAPANVVNRGRRSGGHDELIQGSNKDVMYYAEDPSWIGSRYGGNNPYYVKVHADELPEGLENQVLGLRSESRVRKNYNRNYPQFDINNVPSGALFEDQYLRVGPNTITPILGDKGAKVRKSVSVLSGADFDKLTNKRFNYGGSVEDLFKFFR